MSVGLLKGIARRDANNDFDLPVIYFVDDAARIVLDEDENGDPMLVIQGGVDLEIPPL